jgi:NAD(P)-dependent dehydrogenase (short-subunit alcohol dehydrogenase family)
LSLPLSGRHAVITGASRGIGAAIARELARLGASLTLIARGAAELDKLAADLRRDGATAQTITADLATERGVADAIAQAARGAPVAILINNVGGAQSAPFARTDVALLRRMLDLNLVSAHVATQAVLPDMIASGWGRIVNVASTAGLKAYPYVSAYVAAKHALVGLTRALALETAKSGVTVNAVCPGYTDTPMVAAAADAVAAKSGKATTDIKASFAAANPMGRLIQPQEVAVAVGFLCLPDSAAINGACLPIAGGEI